MLSLVPICCRGVARHGLLGSLGEFPASDSEGRQFLADAPEYLSADRRREHSFVNKLIKCRLNNRNRKSSRDLHGGAQFDDFLFQLRNTLVRSEHSHSLRAGFDNRTIADAGPVTSRVGGGAR